MTHAATAPAAAPGIGGRSFRAGGGGLLRRVLALLLASLVASLLALAPAAAEKRVALVIGNGAYQGFKPLKNPVNDAFDIAVSLKQQGFEVTRGTDLDLPGMREAMRRFTQAAREADVSLFYYAGHGFQADAKNYLVPVDAVIRSRDDIALRTIDLQRFLAGLEGTRGVHLVLLDACRNNPLAGQSVAAGTVQDGLARIGNAAGFLIAFATQPDNVAFDGGGRNSPFAQAVLSHMGTRGQDIASMMIRVRRDVIAATGGFQVPWENSSLTRQFAFAPGAAETASPEVQLWQLAGSSGDPALLRIYLERYPTGAHVADVRSKLEQTKMASLDAGASRSAPAGDPGADDSLWDLARRVRVRPLVEFYLQRHPEGRHADAARELLGVLPAPGDAAVAPETACERAATHPRDGTANAEGVPLDDLVRQADQAIDACRRAVRASPEMPHYKALLARALWAGKGRAEAIRLYREAADLGNLRAMVSLGLILESGDGVPRDVPAALALYERAAEGGSPDGAINLAVALLQGSGIARNPSRAAELLTRASEQGSAIATYNLGVLAQDGVLGSPDKALGYFRRAIDLGDARGYRAAAILLDEGRGTRKAPDAAADMLLRGVSADSGEVLSELTGKAASWSADTLKAVQARLKAAGYYAGPVDGKGGTRLREPLQRWRTSGTPGPKGS